jgi:hypothetical protein
MKDVISWLLEGDVSVQYLTYKLLLDSDSTILEQLQNRIEAEGFGAEFLFHQKPNGHWDLHYYQRKWTSTHYTLLDLKNLGISPALIPCREMVLRLFEECQLPDGGMNLSKYEHPSDVCVDGMVLNYASYFCPEEPRLGKLAEFLLSAQKKDGSFSWDVNSNKGDPHTTICVLEGLGQFRAAVPGHKPLDIKVVEDAAIAFLLFNRLFIDDPDKRYRKLSYPYRYRYDLLRALEYLANQQIPYEPRMQPALDWLQAKRKKDGRWFLENQHKGNVHFTMEEVGKPSRFITLKALTILRYFDSI